MTADSPHSLRPHGRHVVLPAALGPGYRDDHTRQFANHQRESRNTAGADNYIRPGRHRFDATADLVFIDM
jgi:hypothetical protein